MQEKTDPFSSRSYSPPSLSVEFLATKLLAPWRSLTYVYPQSVHSLVPSDFRGSLEPAWLRGDSDQPQYVRRNESPVPLLAKDVPSPPSTKNAPALDTIAASKRTPPHKAIRATLPETGRRVDDLYNRQDQTPEFALISFLRPSSSSEGQAG